ncbi:MAG: glycosyltransferase [Bacteroidales bacterium]|nr:glycosyltransferase [Bacteroidales bacterium]
MILFGLILIVSIAYIGLIISFIVGLNRVLVQPSADNESGMPISVIVAFKDEAVNLPTLLEAMADQSFPKDKFELILVNDHSSDNSIPIAERYCLSNINFKLINLPENRTGKKAAIAYGIDSALYPLIALTDADCLPPKRWLKAVSSEASKGASLMIGPVTMEPLNGIAGKFQALEYASQMASAAGSCGIGHPVIASSANLAFRNDILKVSEATLNPRVTSGDDMFLLHHAKRLPGAKISFMGVKDAIVKTSTLKSLSKALDQRKRWASKSIYYTDRDTIITGFVVLLFSIALIGLLIASFIRIENLFYLLLLITIKSIVDFILLRRYLSFVNAKELIKVFLPLQLIYPMYIAYSFFVSLFTKILWKERLITGVRYDKSH